MKNFLLVITILVILVGAFAVYANTNTYKPDEIALEALGSDKAKVTTTEKYILFESKNGSTGKGYIIYPGGFVDFRAYAPYCLSITLKGDTCAIVNFPFSLAIFGINKANDVILNIGSVSDWSIIGHSLGGPMAARYAMNNSDKIKGIYFLGSYTDVDISNLTLRCATFQGEVDKIVNKTSVLDSENNLPKGCKKITIRGGNHSQFGSYGLQKGDSAANTTIEQQIFEVVDELD